MSTATTGRRIEHIVRDDLRDAGYEVLRAAGSKGPADLACFKTGQVLLVSVKRSTPPGPAERAALLRVAAYLPGVAVPLVALKPPRQALEYRRLTGVGPREWETWVADEVAA